MKYSLFVLLLCLVYSDAFFYSKWHHGIHKISKREPRGGPPPMPRGRDNREDCITDIRQCWERLPSYREDEYDRHRSSRTGWTKMENVARAARVNGLKDVCEQGGATIQCFYDTLKISPCTFMTDSQKAEATHEFGGLRDGYNFICTQHRNELDENKECVFDIDVLDRISTCFREDQSSERKHPPKICTQAGVESCVREVISSTDHCQAEVIPLYVDYLRTHVLKWCRGINPDNGSEN